MAGHAPCRPGRFHHIVKPMNAVLLEQDRLLRAMTPLQKLQLSQELRRTAWLLKEAWIRAQHPALSPAEVEARVRQLFLDAGS